MSKPTFSGPDRFEIFAAFTTQQPLFFWVEGCARQGYEVVAIRRLLAPHWILTIRYHDPEDGTQGQRDIELVWDCDRRTGYEEESSE